MQYCQEITMEALDRAPEGWSVCDGCCQVWGAPGCHDFDKALAEGRWIPDTGDQVILPSGEAGEVVGRLLDGRETQIEVAASETDWWPLVDLRPAPLPPPLPRPCEIHEGCCGPVYQRAHRTAEDRLQAELGLEPDQVLDYQPSLGRLGEQCEGRR